MHRAHERWAGARKETHARVPRIKNAQFVIFDQMLIREIHPNISVRRSLREKTQCTSLNFSDLTQLIGIGSACLEEERNPSAEPKEGKTNGTSREKPRLQQSANIYYF
jgi:hypothetical protein